MESWVCQGLQNLPYEVLPYYLLLLVDKLLKSWLSLSFCVWVNTDSGLIFRADNHALVLRHKTQYKLSYYSTTFNQHSNSVNYTHIFFVLLVSSFVAPYRKCILASKYSDGKNKENVTHHMNDLQWLCNLLKSFFWLIMWFFFYSSFCVMSQSSAKTPDFLSALPKTADKEILKWL